jgi:tetratricopeptide (TPR) repeat protein
LQKILVDERANFQYEHVQLVIFLAARAAFQAMRLMGYLVFILFFLLYASCAPHSIGWKDAGEFTLFAQTLGVAHPAGYPLLLMVGKIFSLLPLGTVAFRLNLLSAFWGAMTVALVYVLMLMLLKKGELGRSVAGFHIGGAQQNESLKVLVALGVAVIFGLSRSFWRFAAVCEAYTLHMAVLVGLLCIFYTITFHPEGSLKRWWLLFFILGLGLGNHVTLILYAPIFLIPFLITLVRERLHRIPLLIGSGVVFFIGLSCYLYLPIRAHADPLMNWGNPDTLGRLFAHLTGKQYALKTFSLPLELFPVRLVRLGRELIAEIPVLFMLAAVPGLPGLFKRKAKAWLPLLALICINTTFFLKYGEWVAHLFLPTYMALYCLIGVAVYECFARLVGEKEAEPHESKEANSREKSAVFMSGQLAIPGLLLLAAILIFSVLAQFWKNRALFYGLPDAIPARIAKNILSPLPRNALLVLEDGNAVNAVLYAQYSERLRNDIMVLDPYGTFYSQAMSKGFHALNGIWWGNLPGRAKWYDFRAALLVFLQNTDQYDHIFVDSTFAVASQISAANLRPHHFLLEYVQAPLEASVPHETWDTYISNVWEFYRHLIINEAWILEDPVTCEALAAYVNNAALVAKQAGLGEKAHFLWKWLLHVDDQSREVLLNLAAYYDDTGNTEEAARYFQKARALYPDDSRALLQMGIYHVRHGRDKEALREFQMAVKLDGLNQQARYNAAVLLHKAGRTQEAKEQLRLLLRINPSHTKAKIMLEQISE